MSAVDLPGDTSDNPHLLASAELMPPHLETIVQSDWMWNCQSSTSQLFSTGSEEEREWTLYFNCKIDSLSGTTRSPRSTLRANQLVYIILTSFYSYRLIPFPPEWYWIYYRICWANPRAAQRAYSTSSFRYKPEGRLWGILRGSAENCGEAGALT